MAWVGNSVKVLLLIWAICGGAAANPAMPCPALQIVAACGAAGAEISVKLGPDVPAGVSFLVTGQSSGQIAETAAQSLTAGGELRLHPLAAAGAQVTLAVLGLEGAAADTPCCFSNQRLHVPDCEVKSIPDQASDAIKPASDLAIDLAFDDSCQRPNAAAICRGKVRLSATDDSFAGAVNISLATPIAEAIVGDDFSCSDFSQGQSLCRFAFADRKAIFDFALKTTAKPPEIKLCATLGIDPAMQALALQAALRDAGYDVGAVDGRIGAKTQTALATFLADAGMPMADAVVPPEALAALGLSDFSDADASNNLSCAVTKLPALPLVCDVKSARLQGGKCQCKFKGMTAGSATACACPKGMVLGKKGCVENTLDPAPTPSANETTFKCNALTTVLRGGACACRYEGMSQISKTACLCETGLPPLPGVGCQLPQIKSDPAVDPVAPAAP